MKAAKTGKRGIASHSAGRLLGRLPPALASAVRVAAELARKSDTPLFVAGGAVRDLLLGRPVQDLDLVIQGDGLAFARRLARRLRASTREHARFGTAALALADGTALDVASSRSEVYDPPGSLPRVRPGELREDLARRDFTINAMAVSLAPPRLFDPHGGRRDLRRGLIRMLHAGSASDDPTRAFRAVRYATRLGFRIEPETARWIRETVRVGGFERLSGDRIRREVAHILGETDRAGAVRRMGRLGLVAVLHPGLRGDGPALARLARAERFAARSGRVFPWFVYLLVWAADLSPREARELGRRLNLPRREARALLRWADARQEPSRRAGSSSRPTEEEKSAEAALAQGGIGRQGLELRIRGRDLVAAGVPPGPSIGRALGATRAARRLGRIAAAQELSFALATARGTAP